MIEELRARFRTRFIETARGRVRRSLELLGSKEGAPELVTELHSLAGEAALLGLQELSDAARTGELSAKQWSEGQATGQLRCARAVRSVSQLVEAFAAEDPAPAGATVEEPAAAKRAHQVLVVDDSVLSGEQVADALSDAGVETRLATDRSTALAAIERQTPDLVVSDVNMPGVNLGELCAAMRARAGAPILVILLSGMPDDELAALARTVGADGYISKQLGTARIVERLTTTLLESKR